MTKLTTAANIDDPDGFYAALIDLHAGLDRDQSEALNARLVLILANHIGDPAILRQAFAAARAPADTRTTSPKLEGSAKP